MTQSCWGGPSPISVLVEGNSNRDELGYQHEAKNRHVLVSVCDFLQIVQERFSIPVICKSTADVTTIPVFFRFLR